MLNWLDSNELNTIHVGGTARESAYFGVGNGKIALDNVQCTGEEKTLLECPTSTDHNCNHVEDAGVICGMNAY